MSEPEPNPKIENQAENTQLQTDNTRLEAEISQEKPYKKMDKIKQYLTELIAEGKLDISQPINKQLVSDISAQLESTYGEKFPIPTIYAVIRSLREETQAEAEEASPESEPTPLIGPVQAEIVEYQPEKPPLTKDEIEANRKFFDRFFTWLGEKVEAEVDPEDKNFIVQSYTDALTEHRAKIPFIVKIGLATVMVIVIYVIPAINKIKSIPEKLKGLGKKGEEKQIEPKPQ